MKSFKGSLVGLALAGILALAPAAAFGHPGGGGGFGGGGGGGHFGGGGGGGHFGGGGGGHFGGFSGGHFGGGQFAAHFGGSHFGGGHFAGFTGRGFGGSHFISDRGGRFASHDGHFRNRDHSRHDRDFFFAAPYGYDYPYYGYDYYPYGYYGYYTDDSGYYTDDSGNYSTSGDVVSAVQEELAHLGYYHGNVDGSLGPETVKAIRWFQSVDKLPVTGRIDDATLGALRVG